MLEFNLIIKYQWLVKNQSWFQQLIRLLAARATGDATLQNFSAQLVQQFIESLEYAPEEEPAENTDDNQTD